MGATSIFAVFSRLKTLLDEMKDAAGAFGKSMLAPVQRTACAAGTEHGFESRSNPPHGLTQKRLAQGTMILTPLSL